MDVHPTETKRANDCSDVLAIGFGVTVAMWAVGYVGHMPLAQVPPAIFVSLMLVCLVAGGWAVERWTPRGLRGAVWVGLLSAAVNLLILGSLLRRPHDGQMVPQAWLWIPGWFALSAVLSAVGSLLGRFSRSPRLPRDVAWVAWLAWITCAAALLLIIAGGLVTGFRAGMAVEDWPNTKGSNMFLFPLAMMTGGVFYEHAHRLLGTLVGLATFTLAIYLTVTEKASRRLVVWIWIVGGCVTLQGIMGGFRVTDDSHCLAVVHGFFAHAVLAGLVATAVMLLPSWRDRVGAVRHPSADADWFLTALLVGVVLLQTMLGTLLRQLNMSLLAHVSIAAVVALVCLAAAVRAWGCHSEVAAVRRCGAALMALIGLQVTLGLVALVFRTPPVGASPTAEALAAGAPLPVEPAPAIITTIHQSTAAVILVVAVVLAVWTWRVIERTPATVVLSPNSGQ